MKRILLTIILFLFLAAPGIGQDQRAEWGMTKDEVKQVESGQPDEGVYDGISYMNYEKKVEGLRATKTYGFDQEGRLFQIEYTIVPARSDRAGSYTRVKDMLIREYGRPNLQIVSPATSRMEWQQGDMTIRFAIDSADARISVLYVNTPMYENLVRSRLLLMCNELEKERLERSRRKNVEMISIVSE